MTTIESSEVPASFPQLLERLASGEEFIIANEGIPVARLVPVETAAQDSEAIATTIERMQEFCRNHSTGGDSVRDMIEEGRRW